MNLLIEATVKEKDLDALRAELEEYSKELNEYGSDWIITEYPFSEVDGGEYSFEHKFPLISKLFRDLLKELGDGSAKEIYHDPEDNFMDSKWQGTEDGSEISDADFRAVEFAAQQLVDHKPAQFEKIIKKFHKTGLDDKEILAKRKEQELADAEADFDNSIDSIEDDSAAYTDDALDALDEASEDDILYNKPEETINEWFVPYEIGIEADELVKQGMSREEALDQAIKNYANKKEKAELTNFADDDDTTYTLN